MTHKREFFLGGQAVLEGVMMRSLCHYAVAVRRMSGEIASQSGPVRSILKRHRWLNIPFIRGIFALGEMMSLGIKTLRFSADIALLDEHEAQSRAGTAPASPPDVGKVTFWVICSSIAFAILFKYGVFFAGPNLIVEFTTRAGSPDWTKHLIEGCFRLLFFVAFLSLLSFSANLRRVFEYHGAEHKVVHLVEARGEMTVANARRHSRIHRRCGTTFLFLVLVISIFVFALFGWGSWKYNLLIRLIMLPVVAGIGYEVVRLTRVKWAAGVAQFLITPGLVFQYLTTREPDDAQLEVAMEAMKRVLNLETETVPEYEPAVSPALAVPAVALLPFR